MKTVDLRTNLKRLRLSPNALIHLTSQSTHKTLTTEQYLSQLIRQGYIDRTDISAAGQGAPKKRGRGSTQQNQDGDNAAAYEWRWGPRAHSEIGEIGIATFASEFMVERAREAAGSAAADREGASRQNRDKLKQAVDKMVEGIGRAAGSALSEIK